MRKIVFQFWLIGSLFLVTAGASHAFYQPGVLKGAVFSGSASPFVPPSQEAVPEGFWKMGDGILLYHFEHGKGRPVLVIHGGPGFPPHEPWEGLERIDQAYTFYYYHQRGCGKSTRPFDRFESQNFYTNMQTLVNALGMTANLADIERIRQILGQEKLILIGHSYGGFMATLYALEFPERVEKMVLISPAGTLTMPPLSGGLDKIKEYLDAAMKEEYDAFLARYFNYGTLFQKNEKELAGLNAEYGRFYAEALKAKGIAVPSESVGVGDNGGWSVHAIYLSLGQRYDFRDRLKEITAPVLVMHGGKDLYIENVSREYADLIPSGRFALIDDASHFAFEETPIRFAELVSGFLKE